MKGDTMASGFTFRQKALGNLIVIHIRGASRQGDMMSKRLSFFCNECGKVIRFFSDVNPYYFDENGKKR